MLGGSCCTIQNSSAHYYIQIRLLTVLEELNLAVFVTLSEIHKGLSFPFPEFISRCLVVSTELLIEEDNANIAKCD